MAGDIMLRLRQAMVDKQMSATELSKLSGVGKSDIHYYLKGRYEPKQDKCYLLAKALGVDPGWLMTGVKPDEISVLEHINKGSPKTKEAKIISNGVDRLPKEQREKLLSIFTDLFDMFANTNNEGELWKDMRNNNATP